MSERHEWIQDDLAAYALGGLDPGQAARVEQHLRECAPCRGIVREYTATLEILPLALSPALPSPRTRLALQARLRTDGRHLPALPARRPWWSPRRWPLPEAVVAGLLLMLIGVGLAGTGLWTPWPALDRPGVVHQLRARDDARLVTLVGSSAAPAASGELVLTADLNQAGVAVRGLPPLPPDRSYQVWFARPDGSWASGGVFHVDPQGQAEALVRLPGPPTAYDGCWITEEPDGGSPVPTGPTLLAAA
jgi:anti-sigma-K factor RskA